MKIKNIEVGDVCYCPAAERAYFINLGPRPCRGSHSGWVVMGSSSSGSVRAFLSDQELRPATMREQCDFWKDAYERVCEETE
jgi:hypothetical protein